MGFIILLSIGMPSISFVSKYFMLEERREGYVLFIAHLRMHMY